MYACVCVCVCLCENVCMRVCLCEGTLRFGFLHSGLGSRVSGLVSGSSSLSIPERLTMRRMVKGRSPRLDTRDTHVITCRPQRDNIL